ncbi:MAG: DUF3576 domain-containing protein [Alphaproteobacteria bacterium]|nr:DUF3576 domain-containing protein [Alphaproteobacteria bacterium]
MPAKNAASTISRVALVLTALGLASCSSLPAPKPAEEPVDRTFGEGSLINNDGEQGISLSKLLDPQANSGAGALPINALLWRASLDTVSVLPLSSVDTFGGSIITEWYAHPEEQTQRIKVSIFVIGQELRADSIKVYVYLQERPEGMFDWSDAGRDQGLATRLEDLILTRAREIRAAAVSESN